MSYQYFRSKDIGVELTLASVMAIALTKPREAILKVGKDALDAGDPAQGAVMASWGDSSVSQVSPLSVKPNITGKLFFHERTCEEGVRPGRY